MHKETRRNRGICGLLVALLMIPWWFTGCALCTKRLYLYRDTPEKGRPTSEMALMITDPQLAEALSPAPPRYSGKDCQWAAEDMPPDAEAYRLSIQDLDSKPLYQGLCLNTTPTYVCEVRPGERQVRTRLELSGPWGRESIREVTRINLTPGSCYFLRADCEAMQKGRLLLQVERLPYSFTPALRSRVIDWVRNHYRGRSLAD